MEVGDYVDISGGPLVGDTGFLGRRCTVPAAHLITHNGVPIYRFQVGRPSHRHTSKYYMCKMQNVVLLVATQGRMQIGWMSGVEASFYADSVFISVLNVTVQ